MYLVRTAAQMKAADAATINAGLPSLVLMERAALSVLQVLKEKKLDLSSVCILCGPGNNGADGAALARLLAEEGFRSGVILFGYPEKFTDELKLQLELLGHYDVKVSCDALIPDSSTVIIDCLFGVGLKRDVSGIFADIIDAVNDSDAPVVSVDIPSGLSADTGHILGTAVRADITVGISDVKPGYYICDGKACCGELVIKNIGIMDIDGKTEHSGYVVTDEDFTMLPARNEAGNKATFGKLLVIAGSDNISGAAYLCAEAALSSGIGMVHIFTHKDNRDILGVLLPEALITTYGNDSKDLEKLPALLEWADACAIGPGIGTGDFSKALLDRFLKLNTLPAVMDADALNIIASDDKYKDIEIDFPAVVTPHIGEMSRLTGLSISEIKADPVNTAVKYAGRTGFMCVLKDAVTITACPDGEYYINSSGCSALATAGSGDVLCGMIAGFLLRYKDSGLPLIPIAVHEHGKRGENAAKIKGADAVLASDLI